MVMQPRQHRQKNLLTAHAHWLILISCLIQASLAYARWSSQAKPLRICLLPHELGDIGWLTRRVLHAEARRAAQLWNDAPCTPRELLVELCSREQVSDRSTLAGSIGWSSQGFEKLPDGRRPFARSSPRRGDADYYTFVEILLDSNITWLVADRSLRSNRPPQAHSASFTHTIAHELGHLLGLGHIEDIGCEAFSGREQRKACEAQPGCSWRFIDYSCLPGPDVCPEDAPALMCASYQGAGEPRLLPADIELLCRLYESSTPWRDEQIDAQPAKGMWLTLWRWLRPVR